MIASPPVPIAIAWLALGAMLLGNLGLAGAAPLRQGGRSTGPSSTATFAPPTIAPILDEPGAPRNPGSTSDASDQIVETVSDPHARPRGDRREVDIPVELDEGTGAARVVGSGGDPDEAAGERLPRVPRLAEPVLRWLPEIMAASEEFDIPAELVAGMMRLESSGEPGVISPVGARGLMQVMPDNLARLGFAEASWHDPASNVRAGARMLSEGTASQGSLQGSVQAYFGFGCDVYGTCTDVYVRVAFGWADYYRPIIANPTAFGIAVLPGDWSYGPIVLYQVPTPPAPEEPPPLPTPESETATPTPSPTRTPSPEPTRPGETPRPTAPPDDPATEVPTAIPTEIPATAISTEVPTEIPTETPTETPTEIPTVAPPPEPRAEGDG